MNISLEELKSKTSQVSINGGNALKGEVIVDGAKNSALVLLAASCLADGNKVVLKKVPNISDVWVLKSVLEDLGLNCTYDGNVFEIDGNIKNCSVSKENASKIRASIACLGSVLSVKGEIELPLPGGDNLGDRPIDIHLECFESMGVKFNITGGVIYAKADEYPLKGTQIFLRYPSVLATCNMIMAATRAKGKTIIKNAAKEPEIVDLSIMLNKMGAKIIGAGTDTITINGVDTLYPVQHEVIPDRIETGSLVVAIAITGGTGIIRKCIPEHNSALISILRKSGLRITTRNEFIRIAPSNELNAFNATALPYPGLATDLQPLITCFATKCKGESIISDTVFPNRFSYVPELQKIGAKISQHGNQVRVVGGEELVGTSVEGNDIRAVTALICAGLAANGITKVSGMDHLHRGYSSFIDKLIKLGADIEYI